MTPTVAAILAYVLVQLGVAFVVSRRIRTEDDYLVAGRSLGPLLASFSLFATWFGAETCIGAAGAVYEEGLSGARADPFGYTVTLVLVGLLATRLWTARITTLGDLFRQRYSRSVERLSVILLIPTSIFWAAAQIRAFGQILASASDGLSASAGVTLAAIAVLVYTVWGGLLADAWTDLLQGIVLSISLAVLTVAILHDTGGLGPALSAVEPSHWSLVAPGESLLATANRWALPMLGSLTAQELVSRIVACRSPGVARQSAGLAATGYLAVGLMPVGLGLVATGLPIQPGDPEHVLPALASAYLPTAGYLIFVGAMVSAILSTVDSCLLVAGSFVSHNLVVPVVPGISERTKLRAARAAVIGSGLVAWWLALGSQSVLDLVEEANGFGTAGVLVLMVFGLFGRFGGPPAALASLVAGIAGWLLFHWLAPVDWDFLGAVALALTAYVGVAAFEPEKRPAQHV
jgi:solute:Na+ symporter, SSS family